MKRKIINIILILILIGLAFINLVVQSFYDIYDVNNIVKLEESDLLDSSILFPFNYNVNQLIKLSDNLIQLTVVILIIITIFGIWWNYYCIKKDKRK